MDMLLIELYQKINGGSYKNRADSQYWVYSIENIITKENGVSKRYLKVLFFNRKMNESSNLMRLYLNINGEAVVQDLFNIVSDYNHPSVLGFIKEIDLIEEKKDVCIEGYVVDGKKVEVTGNVIDSIRIAEKQKELSALKEYYFKENVDVLVYPTLTDAYWICCCGYCNDDTDLICPICAKKKVDIQELLKIDTQQLVLSEINNRIQVHADASVSEIIETYKTSIAQKYGIATAATAAAIDVERLAQRQNSYIVDKIKKYVQENEVTFDTKKSFEDNINAYCSGCTTSVITNDMIISKLDMEDLKGYYTRQSNTHQKQAKKNKRIFVYCIVAVVLICAVNIGYRMLSKSDYEGIETYYNKAYRESVCAETIENTLFNEVGMEQLAKFQFLCNFDIEDKDVTYPKTIKDGNKEIRPLDEEYVLIKESEELSSTQKKIYYYISDLDGDIVYDYRMKDYYLETYNDGKINNSKIYNDGTLVNELTWDYTDDNNYVISYHNTIENYISTRYYYEDDVLVKQVSPAYPNESSDYIYNYDYVYKYNYNEGNLDNINIYIGDTLTGIHYYEQNRIKRITEFEGGVEKLTNIYYYDTNGFLTKYEGIGRYNYTAMYAHDFAIGKIYYAGYENRSSNPQSMTKGQMFFYPDMVTGYDSFADLSWISFSRYEEVY